MLGLIMTSYCFSNNIINDSSSVLLSTPTAKLIIKDLIRYDGLKKEIIIKDGIINLKNVTILSKDSMIGQQNKLISNLNKELKDSQEQFQAQQKITKSIEDKLSQQKKTTWIAGGVGVAVGILIKLLFIN